jgi:hypothetical protein
VRTAETLLAAAMVVVLGVAAGIVAGVHRSASAPRVEETAAVRPAQRFAVAIAGRQIVVELSTSPHPSPSATPSPTPGPRRNPPPTPP